MAGPGDLVTQQFLHGTNYQEPTWPHLLPPNYSSLLTPHSSLLTPHFPTIPDAMQSLVCQGHSSLCLTLTTKTILQLFNLWFVQFNFSCKTKPCESNCVACYFLSLSGWIPTGAAASFLFNTGRTMTNVSASKIWSRLS